MVGSRWSVGGEAQLVDKAMRVDILYELEKLVLRARSEDISHAGKSDF